MTTRFTFALALSYPLLAAGSALAAPVNYDEAIDGDLPFSGSPLPTLAFDLGINTVKGATGIEGIDLDFDSFAFTVPVGTQLVSLSLELTDSSRSTGNFNEAVWQFHKGSAIFRAGTDLGNVEAQSPGTSTFTALPVGADVYHLGANSFSASGSSFGDYTFTFELTQVPEPTSLALLGLGGLLIARRRRLA